MSGQPQCGYTAPLGCTLYGTLGEVQAFQVVCCTYKGLVTNYGRGGGGTKREGGHMKFYPYEKGGGRKSFSHSEGGAQKVLG